MPSEVSICNAALIKINASSTIISLTEDTKAARLCNLRFADVLDMVLRAYPWNCALARAALARHSTAPAFEYTYQYQLPADCLRVVSEYNEEEYVIEGRMLLTDGGTIQIRYVKRITDVNLLDGLVVEAMACYLAQELAVPLVGSSKLRDAMARQFAGILRQARMVDAKENSVKKVQSGNWSSDR